MFYACLIKGAIPICIIRQCIHVQILMKLHIHVYDNMNDRFS